MIIESLRATIVRYTLFLRMVTSSSFWPNAGKEGFDPLQVITVKVPSVSSGNVRLRFLFKGDLFG